MSIRSLRGSAALLLCLGLTTAPALAEEEPVSPGTITLTAPVSVAPELNSFTDHSDEGWDYMPGEEHSVNLFLTKTF